MRLTLGDINLRVNGVPVEHVSLRFQIVDGYPGGPKEIVINDPILGQFHLDDAFAIEVQEGEGPWRPQTAQALITLIEARGSASAR